MKYTKEKLEKLKNRWTTTKGKRLLKKIKETRCYLSPILYRKVVQNFPHINDDEVVDGIDLRGINLAGFDFRVPVLEDESGFEEELAILSYIHFEGATLKHATFQDGKVHDCFFENADLSHSNFKAAALNTCSFQNTDMTGTLLGASNLINCNFTNTTIRDINFSTVLTDQNTVFSEKLKDEKEENFHLASVQYKQIKEMYKNSSLHSQADTYHYREMVSRRKTLKWYNPVRTMNLLFADLTCKYGTSIVRILLWITGVVIGFAFVYWTMQNVLYHNSPTILSFLDSLYFSLITYATVGYGDIHPIGDYRLLAGIEGMIGVILTSLFTVIVARRIIRD
jgi:uncharacterized protein YjbI with pentapeptide repeats